MEITFDLVHVFNGRGNAVHNAEALKILLDCLVNLNLAYLRHTKARPLYSGIVRYQRGKIWMPIPSLYKARFGDCKSLAAALVAEYRSKGIAAAPVFRFKERKDGSVLYHILVMVPKCNGYEKKLYEDPSARLGMGLNDVWEILDIS
jgi:hypothetical protein